ncbi:DUF1707 domain-containing protein [Micromonospora soli]|uniref:DUF1707 SHOCT-like domain-containing protein n=1 Tax=Micromonospora sp. NBRC 110009 TaxID=3061627 RepID=UPI0026715C85|nr:DUF1707 domain-containing protein [Micromonospora sp. NBRC 110009]WKU01644.1 DUF1707 domain-containing protein [Micromonospora sp. NBRC 110009]
MDGRSGMRAADADRAATAERLRVALEEGRLDLHEYDERLVRAYQAKTYAELDEVVADLPGATRAQRAAVAPSAPSAPTAPAPDASEKVADNSGRGAGWVLAIWSPWLRVAGILTVIWLFASVGSGHLGHYWPAWAIGPWGFFLLMRTVGGHDHGWRHSTERRRKDRRDRRRRY